MRLLSASGRSFSIKQLAEQLRVSKSTIERDLATLEHLFPVVDEAAGAQKRRYRITGHPRDLDAARPFGPMQLLALYVALEMMLPLRDTPFFDDLTDVVQTVRALLAERHNGGLDRLATVFRAEPPDGPAPAIAPEVLDDLVDAIAQGRTCELRFRTRGRAAPAALGVKPRRLVWQQRALRVTCHDDQTHDLRDIAEVTVARPRKQES